MNNMKIGRNLSMIGMAMGLITIIACENMNVIEPVSNPSLEAEKN